MTSLAELQAQAVATLATLPPGLAREARQVGAELQLIADGKVSSYQPISRSGGGSQIPVISDRFPAHIELTGRIARAAEHHDPQAAVESAVTWARQEHTALLHPPKTKPPRPETAAERDERIVRYGAGLLEAEAAASLNVTCRQVRDARKAHGRDLHDGWSVRAEHLEPAQRQARARELARQGIPITVIAQRLRVDRRTIHRDLEAQAA